MASPSVSNGATTTGALSSALAHIGDRWTLLAVAALLDGPQRFSDLVRSIEGIATNVLTSRLRALERLGLVIASPYSERPLRFEYQLTDAGLALADAIRILAVWGTTVDAEEDKVLHTACSTPLEVRYYCPGCDEVVTDPDETWL